MGSSQRTKGHNWEREVANRFKQIMPGADVRRGIQARTGGETCDVETPVFHVECKVGKKPNIPKALDQAISEARNGKVPIAIVKKDRCDPTVTLLLSDFLDFIEEWWKVVKQ